jgi:putative ABC transport system permease protein
MTFLRPLIRGISSLLNRHKADNDVSKEIEHYIEEATQAGISMGLTPEEARTAARRELGSATTVRLQVRESGWENSISTLIADIRYALRGLRRSPVFSTTVLLTLALGVGANLAVFQLLYSVQFAPLPVQQPGQLHSLHSVQSPFDGEWFFSFPAYQRLRQATQEDAPVFARSGFGEGVFQQRNGTTSRAGLQLVSDNFFKALNLSPFAGRFFLPGDDQREQPEWPVILRYGYFKEHFGADRSILGTRAILNSVPIVIVGIAPEGFDGVVPGQAPAFWLPLAAHTTEQFGTWFDSLGPGYNIDLKKSYLKQDGIFWLWIAARIPDGLSPVMTARWTAAIQPDLSLIAKARKDPRERTRILAAQVTLASVEHETGSLTNFYSRPLTILMAMALAILLVGSLNLANLQMARLLGREAELATKIALGASRARILRQIMAESFLLSAIGGVLAVAIGQGCASLLLHWAALRHQTISFDPKIGPVALLFGTLLLSLTFLGSGLVPAWRITKKSFSVASPGRAGRLSQLGKSKRNWANLLLAGQVSFSLLLLCGAALFAQTLRNLNQVDTGVDREHVLSIHVDMRRTGFAKKQENLSSFYEAATDRLKALPMVADAAVHMCTIPFCGWNTIIHPFGITEIAEERLHGEEDHVGIGYFHTLGIPILRGRDFGEEDNENSQSVAILSHSYAQRLFGNNSPIGHWIGYNDSPGDHQFLVVGEVSDARVNGPRSSAPPVVYIPLDQSPAPVQSIEVRVRGSLRFLPTELRTTLHELAPELPITEIVPLDIEFQDAFSREILLARLTSVFGLLALGLAALGFYGLLSFYVTGRTSEIGIRMALGATRGQVLSLFLKQSLTILILGMVPGTGLSIIMGHMARKLLYGTSPTDLSALVLAMSVLAAAGFLATIVPARRAALIEPMRALRHE